MDIAKLPIFGVSSTLSPVTSGPSTISPSTASASLSAKADIAKALPRPSTEVELSTTSIKPLSSPDKISIIVSPLSFDPSIYSKPRGVTQHTFSNPEQKSPLTQKFADQLEKDFSPHRLSGLGSRFGELITTGANSYQQDIRRYSFYESSVSSSTGSAANSATKEVDFSEFNIRSKGVAQSFSLDLKTDSGAVIKFSLKSYEGDGKNPDSLIAENDHAKIFQQGQSAGFRGIEIEFEVEGELTQREQEQLAAFGKNLEKFSNNLFTDSQPSLKALNLSSFDTISEASIKANGGSLSSGGLSLEYKDSDKYRSISLSFQGNKSEISVDKTNQLTFNADSKAEALQQYLKILSDSASEAKADSMQAHMMKEVFSAGFTINEKEEALADLKEKERNEKITADLRGNTPKTGEISNDLFVPLADFDFSFESRKDRPNAKKPQEYSGFDLELSLDSQKSVKGNKITSSQTQDFKLSGAYHEPLLHLMSPDFKHQNYRYTTLEREASKTVTTEVEDGQLQSALMEESISSKSHTSTYSEDKLIDEDSTQNSYFEVTDLMDVFFKDKDMTKKNNQLDILNAVMIDPFKARD